MKKSWKFSLFLVSLIAAGCSIFSEKEADLPSEIKVSHNHRGSEGCSYTLEGSLLDGTVGTYSVRREDGSSSSGDIPPAFEGEMHMTVEEPCNELTLVYVQLLIRYGNEMNSRVYGVSGGDGGNGDGEQIMR